MKCPTVDELSIYVDDTLTGMESARMDAHVKKCPGCKQIVDTFIKEQQFIRETLETPTLPDDFPQMVLDQLEPYEKKVHTSKRLFWNRMKKSNNKQMNEVPQVKRKKRHILIAAASLFIALPATAVGAAKVYDLVVNKQGYEVNVSVENHTPNKDESWYKLQVGYLPENMETLNGDDMKYSFRDNDAPGGFSFILWRLGENTDIKTLYSTDYKEVKINENSAVVINKDTGNDNVYDRSVLVFFEEEGIMLESYVGADVTDEQMMDVLEHLSLESTTQELASSTMDYDEFLNQEVVESEIIPLKKDSKQLFSVGQTIPVKVNGENNQMDELEYVVNQVEVHDSLEAFNKADFNDYSLEKIEKYTKVKPSELMKLPAYQRDVYKVGDGKNSIHKLAESTKVNIKFVHLTTTVKNTSNHKIEELYMTPTVQVLKSENDTWSYAEQAGMNEQNVMTGEVDYLLPHGEGKAFYNIGALNPGETVEVQLGYFVDEDKLDSIFLDAFNYGYDGSEDMNDEKRWWIDVRQ